MELTTIHTCSRIHENIQASQTRILIEIKTHNDTYLWNSSNSTNYMQTFNKPPSLRPRYWSRSAVGYPWVGTKLHPRQGNHRLGWGYRKTAQCNWKDSLQEPSYAHYSQTLIPHMHVPPGSIHLHKNSPLVASPPSLGLGNRLDLEFAELCS